MGSLLLDENKTDVAISNLFQAVEISPRDSKAHELLGKAYARLDQLRKAQTELEKALDLSPQSTNPHCMLAPVYRKQGLTEKAKLEFDRCAAMHVTHSSPEPPRR
ncbi:MAG TPA: tetratricopeptide repeat protein [Candidatus Limnocylindria bacterium]|nr:tetratricopeptide repeat protein [Candidatus Limnocylindria bacterium]